MVQVEYYPGDRVGGLAFEPECKTPILSDEDDVQVQYSANPQIQEPHQHSKIADSLAQLGFYARSMKPLEGWERTGSVLPCYSDARPDVTLVQISRAHRIPST